MKKDRTVRKSLIIMELLRRMNDSNREVYKQRIRSIRESIPVHKKGSASGWDRTLELTTL